MAGGMAHRTATATGWLARGVRLPLAAAAAALVVYTLLFADGFDIRLLTIAGTYVILVIGYQFIFGHAGALSLAQGAFFGLGAYVTAIAVGQYGLGAPLGFVLAVIAPVALAVIVALPVLRLATHYFALATLGISQIVWLVAVNWEDVTGGSNGLGGIPEIEILGTEFAHGWPELAVVWLIATLAGLIAWQAMRGIYGLAFRVMCADPLAADAAGINAGGLRFSAFLLSAGYGGAAGALHAHVIGVVSPETVAIPVLIACLTMAVVGGRTRVAGAVIGAVLLIQLPEWVRFLEDYYLIAYGAALLLMIIVAPSGLVGAMEALRARLLPEEPAESPRPVAPWVPRKPQRGSVLEIEDLSKSFGGILAVDEVSLTIRRSEIFGLIGPNGSGKTTLANLVTGYYSPDGGRVRLDGRNITRRGAWRIARAGIGRTFQSTTLVESMTALDNVAAARMAAEGVGLRAALTTFGQDKRLARARANAVAMLRDMGAGDVAMALCSALPHGLRRRVEIARALALAPDLLILDEPAAGLTEAEQEELAGRLRSLTEDGVSLLIVEHNMPFLMPLADRLACLEEGRLIAWGTPEEVRNDPRVIEAYLGVAPVEDVA